MCLPHSILANSLPGQRHRAAFLPLRAKIAFVVFHDAVLPQVDALDRGRVADVDLDPALLRRPQLQDAQPPEGPGRGQFERAVAGKDRQVVQARQLDVY